MTLTPGFRVRQYEIIGSLGAGGMGEVYRAHDTRLRRDVALKLLPDLFANDPERLGRFEREAQVLASLNHPHIAAIYGLEKWEAPAASGQASQFLVLELVEGETLADRLEKARPRGSAAGGLPLPEALPLARQIADGLQAAHERGIVHRDLKPSNIALTDDGQAKILDFGLAKLEDAAGPESPLTSDPNAATMPPLAMASKSPTISPAMTAAGVILGTAPYMSPEQAKGRPADKRSDVWAFGCVLYEMLTGKPAFGGDDVSDTLANVLKTEPDWSVLPSHVPPAVRTLVQKCLEKDRRTRTADISVASFVLDSADALAPAQTAGAAPGITGRSRWRDRAVFAMVALILGSAVTGTLVWYAASPRAALVSRLAITTSGTAAFAPAGNDREVAVSPDGRRVAYVGANGTIFVRALDQLEPTALTRLGLPRGLFFSPDGQWIGFFDAAIALRKVAVTGGAPITLCRITGPARGATWGRDDTVVFATNDPASGLMRVPAGGGDPVTLTRPNRQNDEGDHLWPEALPEGKAVLFTIVPATSSIENARIAILDLQRGTQKVLLDRGTDAHYLPSGHIVYAQGGTARAVAFDPNRFEVKSTPVQVLPQVVTSRFGAGVFDVSLNGTLVYRPSDLQLPTRALVWVDRQGREEATPLGPRAYQYPRLSPEGKRVALEIQGDIWIWELGRDTPTRLTFDPAPDQFPVWTPDGRRIIFGSDRTSNGQANLFVQSADGSGSAERLTESPNQQFPMSIAPDGKWLVFRESAPSIDLMALSLEHPKEPARPLMHTSSAELGGEISPNGRWLAYQSNESGRFEIYVRPFPNVEAGRWQISTDGGTQPLWSKDGEELFYLAPNAVMAVSVARGSHASSAWSSGATAKVFDDSYYHGAGAAVGRTYDVSADGRRFLMIKPTSDSRSTDAAAFIVVENWFEELKRLVPSK
jgi:serine/threonine protein kinase